LDYGCGKGTLGDKLRDRGFPVLDYDPCYEGKDVKRGRKFDFITCMGVLEHVEEEFLDNVLKDISRRLTRKGKALFVIGTGLSNKTLPDGRNAHILLKERSWWVKQVSKWFVIRQKEKKGDELTLLCRAL
jgi:SAM-dependent methyltransferase